MKRRIASLFLMMAMMPSVWFLYAAEPILDSLKVDGHVRRFWMKIPESADAGAPLVFVLHGYGNPGDPHTWMDAVAEKNGFALCIPQGLKDPAGNPSWNVGYPSQDGWDVDDVKAMCRMAAFVQKKYRLSKANTFLTGMSNGGDLCYVLAYSGQKTFRAFGSLSGLTMEWVYRTQEAQRPVPIMEVHGTEDRVSEWDGDLENKGGWGKYMSTPQSIGYWIAKNRCEGHTQERVEGKQNNGIYIIKHKYDASSTSGCDIWLYQVVGGPHSWFDKDLDIGDEVWRFFCKYLR